MGKWWRSAPPAPPPEATMATDPLNFLNNRADPWSHLVQTMTWPERNRTRVLIGQSMDRRGTWQIEPSGPESNVLIVGPPRSNKSVGKLAPMIMAHVGPRVVMSTKRDLARLTSVVCSRMGPVWHLDATGGAPIRGLIPARWSLVSAASTWSDANKIASSLTSAGTEGDRTKFWANQAADLLAIPFYAAFHGGLGMDLVLDVVLKDESAIARMEQILTRAPEGEQALRKWDSIQRDTHSDGLGSILMSARDAMRIFERREVLAQQRHPNFNIDTFIRGEPDVMNLNVLDGSVPQAVVDMALRGVTQHDRWPAVGRYGTIFVTAGEDDTNEAQTIYRTFMRQLWKKVKLLHEEDNDNGVTNRRPTLLVMDELANIAPDPIYLSMVAQCPDQGLIVASGVQDPSLLETHFGAQTKAIFTVHRETLLFRGVSNDVPLQMISNLMGHYWERRSTEGTSTTQGKDTSRGVSANESDHRVPVLDVGQLRAGMPGDPEAVLRINPDRSHYLRPMPIYRSRPWPRAIIASLERQLSNHMEDSDGILWANGLMPVPDLGRVSYDDPRNPVPWLVATQPDGPALYQRYLTIKAAYADMRERLGPEHAERIEIENEIVQLRAEADRLRSGR